MGRRPKRLKSQQNSRLLKRFDDHGSAISFGNTEPRLNRFSCVILLEPLNATTADVEHGASIWIDLAGSKSLLEARHCNSARSHDVNAFDRLELSLCSNCIVSLNNVCLAI